MAAPVSALKRFMTVAKPYWVGDRRVWAWTFLAGLIVLMLADTQLAVLLNNQTGELTSALAARDEDRFWTAVRAMCWKPASSGSAGRRMSWRRIRG